MVKIFVDGVEKEVEAGVTVLQALEGEGVQVPKFCYHDRLKIAGNCRMCLVEISPGPPKPQASCATNVAEGMQIKTDTEMVKKARAGVMEFLLANHPLDCPVCDQGGECDLQDQAFIYGKDSSRFLESKRAVEEKSMGPLIKTQMTRCIQCTRCVRFMEDVAGTSELGAFGRGNEMEIATFLNNGITSELSGNIIDLCPVGALTAKPYNSSYRSWELKRTDSIDVFDGLGSAISIHSKAGEVVRVLPRINEEINEEWISDKSRFAIDGLLNQRLETCYVKNADGKLVSTSFEEAFNFIQKKLSGINLSSQFAAITGDFTDAETIFALKDLMHKFGSPFTESRQKDFSLNVEKRENYIFNSGIAGIDEADFILIIGSNPRIEAPVLNARIRRNIVERKVPAFIVGENVDLTYKINHLGVEKKILDDILNGTHEIIKTLGAAKKPMIIIGIDAFLGEDGLAVHEKCLQISDKYFQKENWNGFNVLHQNSSTVAAFDAKFISSGGTKEILNKCKNKEIKALYLLGADEIETKDLQNTFIIYQGSHGDKIAQIADVILPSSAYTEKNATFFNTEGKAQKTTKAVNPVGIAKDDSEIVKLFGEKFGFLVSSKFIPYKIKQDEGASELQASFSLAKKSFYMSDYISRNSPSMAKAVKELK